MSKRAGGSTRVRATKIKKRKGVGSRTIVVLDSDEDVSLPTAASDYARVMKTRVGASGEAKGFTMGTIPILDVDKVDISTPLPEADTNGSADTVGENVVHVLPAKPRKRANDSVSYPGLLVLRRR